MTQRTDNDAAGGVAAQAAPEWVRGESVCRATTDTLPPMPEAQDRGPGAFGSTPGWRDSLPAWLDRRCRQSLWLSLGVSVVVGVVYADHLGSALRFYDEHVYVAITDNLVRHATFSSDGVHATAYQAPGWPLLLAAVHVLGGGIVAYRLVNVALFASCVALGWWIAREMGGKAVAALAAPMLALYPLAVFTEETLYPETLASALLLAGLAAAVRARRASGPSWWAVGAGTSFGALVLVVPNAWIPLAAVLVWLALGRRRLWHVATCVLLVALALVSVWVVRNAVTFHEFIPVTDANGYNLLLANSEDASVRSGVNPDISLYTAAAEDQGITSEVGLQSFYRTEALDWIRAHPGRASELYGERVLDYFAPFDELATISQRSAREDLLATLTYVPLLVLLALRLLRWRSDRPGSLERLAIWIYLLNAPVAAVFVTRIRYRVPFDELLILVAASSLVSLLAVRPGGRHAAAFRGAPGHVPAHAHGHGRAVAAASRPPGGGAP